MCSVDGPLAIVHPKQRSVQVAPRITIDSRNPRGHDLRRWGATVRAHRSRDQGANQQRPAQAAPGALKDIGRLSRRRRSARRRSSRSSSTKRRLGSISSIRRRTMRRVALRFSSTVSRLVRCRSLSICRWATPCRSSQAGHEGLTPNPSRSVAETRRPVWVNQRRVT